MSRLIAILFILTAVHSTAQELIQEVSVTTLSDQMIASHQYERALRFLEDKGDSTDLQVIYKKAICHARLGNYAQAIEQFETVLEKDSAHINTMLQLGQLYARNGDIAKSRSVYENLVRQDSSNSYYVKQYAATSLQLDDFTTAATWYFKALALNPRDIESNLALGNILLETDQYKICDSLLTTAVSLTDHLQLKILRARALVSLERFEEVIEVATPLVEKDTTVTLARLLGVSYFQTTKYAQVIPMMNFLIASGSDSDWIWYYMGASMQQLGRHEEAIPYLRLAIERGISENIGNYYSQLAIAYEEMKEYKLAIKYYKAAYESTESDIMLYHLARNYDTFYKDKSQAVAYYTKYLGSEDTIKLAKEYSKYRLRQLRNNK